MKNGKPIYSLANKKEKPPRTKEKRELLDGGQPPVVFFAMSILFGGIAIHTIWLKSR